MQLEYYLTRCKVDYASILVDKNLRHRIKEKFQLLAPELSRKFNNNFSRAIRARTEKQNFQ